MNKNLRGALPLIASMLGRKLDVEVVVGGARACTDGKTIYLPDLPVEDEKVAVLANGYIDHEAAHIRYTNFGVVKPKGLLGSFLNLLEDIRIEKRLVHHYPGCRHNLAALVAALEADKPSLIPESEPIEQQVFQALYAMLRYEVLGQTALAQAAQVMPNRLRTRLGNHITDALLTIALEVNSAQSTQDALDLAERIMALLQEEADDGQSGKSSDDSESSQNDQATPFFGAESDDAGSAQASDESGQPELDQDAQPDAGDQASTELAKLLSLPDYDVPETDLGKRVSAKLEHQVTQHPLSQRIEVAQVVTLRKTDKATAHRLCTQARTATAALRRRLATLVQTTREDECWHSQRGHKLSGRRLYQAGMPDRAALFQHRHEHSAPETAIGVLLDRSSSMVDDMELACQSVLSLILALDEIPGVASWSAAFPWGGSQRERILKLKGFSESARQSAVRFDLRADGGTPLDSVLWATAVALAPRQEPRKMILVVTDGEADDNTRSVAAITQCQQLGIEVLGLGIGSYTAYFMPKVFGDNHTVIANIKQLAPELFKLLEQHVIQ